MPAVDQPTETDSPAQSAAEFHFESLLLEMQQARDQGRRREAVFLSIIVHLMVVILVLINPKIFHDRNGALIGPVDLLRSGREQITFLESPLKTPKPPHPVHSNVISDRDRLFNRHDRVVDSISAPPALRRQPPPMRRSVERAMTPPAPPPGNNGDQSKNQVAENKPAQQLEKTETAQNDLKLQDVPKPQIAENHPLMLPGLSAESQMQRAVEGAARTRMSGAPGLGQMSQLPTHGGLPSGNGGRGQVGTGVAILSDTQGVDFAPYLERIVHTVKENWYAVMPEVAYLGRKGRVVIVFKIQRNGHVPGLNLVGVSGTEALDRAALAAISASNPFPPLPQEFSAPEIVLQFSFFYNYAPNELPQ